MAASHDDIKKLVSIAREFLPPHALSMMVSKMYDAVKDSKNKSVVTTFKRLVEATSGPVK